MSDEHERITQDDYPRAFDRLAAIRRRLDAIIPGPWRWYGNTATDQVYLATVGRGRLFILTVDTRAEEYVFDHRAMETYEIEDARSRVHERWCPTHAQHVDPVDPGQCMCDALREFLSGELDLMEGRRDFDHEDRGYRITLTRNIQVHPDLRFPVCIPAPRGVDAEAAHKRHGGVMRSYRDRMPRYEVLGYRTAHEWEMDQGGVQNARDQLYREDFVGLDNPEADFIQHSAEDVKFLLDYIHQLELEIAEADARIEDLKDAAHD